MRALLVALVLTATWGCGAADAPSAAVVQDSAGVRVVESRAPAWTAGEGWSVAEEPLLSIGTLEGDAALAFGRLAGAYLVGDGTIAALDGGAGMVRFFGVDGAPRGTFGRSGEGPGEFVDPRFLGLRADSLWLLDPRTRRITVVDPASGAFRLVRIATDQPRLEPVGLLPDGSPLLTADLTFPVDPASMESGLQRPGAAYLRLTAGGIPGDTLLVAPGAEVHVTIGRETIEVLRSFAARRTSHAVADGLLFQGSQDAYEIGLYDTAGTLLRILRRTDVDTTVDDAAYEAAVERRVMEAPEPARAGMRTAYLERVRPTQRPAHREILVGSEDHLWVRDFAWDGEARSWAVFDPEGPWLGTVEMPEGFRPTQILEDRIVGVWRDPLGVEYVRIHRLERT